MCVLEGLLIPLNYTRKIHRKRIRVVRCFGDISSLSVCSFTSFTCSCPFQLKCRVKFAQNKSVKSVILWERKLKKVVLNYKHAERGIRELSLPPVNHSGKLFKNSMDDAHKMILPLPNFESWGKLFQQSRRYNLQSASSSLLFLLSLSSLPRLSSSLPASYSSLSQVRSLNFVRKVSAHLVRLGMIGLAGIR